MRSAAPSGTYPHRGMLQAKKHRKSDRHGDITDKQRKQKRRKSPDRDP